MEDFATLTREVCAWADEVFGDHQDNSGKVAHLVEEVYELAEAPDSMEEVADCLLLLMDIGRDPDAMLEAVRRKLKVNQARTWGPQESDGVIHHVPEKDSDADAAAEEEEY